MSGTSCAWGSFMHLCTTHAPVTGESPHLTGEDSEALRFQVIYLEPRSQPGEKDVHPGFSRPKPDQAAGSQTSVLYRLTQGVWKMLMPRSRPRDPDLIGLGGVWALRLSNVPQECPTAAELESPRDTRPLTHTARPTLMSGCEAGQGRSCFEKS